MIRSAPGVPALVIVLALATASSSSAAIPDWVRQAHGDPATEHVASGSRGVALLDETAVTVLPDGDMRIVRRKVYRILSTDGRDLAVAQVFFDDDTKLERFNAWSIGADGSEHQMKEREAVETAAFDGELYADDRVKFMRLPTSGPGSVVAFEYAQRTRPYGLQAQWSFQQDVPVRIARYLLTLPSGWGAHDQWFNSPRHEPESRGNQRAWEIRDVEATGSEPGMPSRHAVAARMIVNFQPPQGLRLRVGSHGSWDDIARWYHGLAQPRTVSTPQITSGAAALTAGRDDTLQRIGALGEFVQREIRYVAIAIGIGGYQPHAADQIFSVRYGDCKDKVTLLVTMLRETGIDAHFVLVHTEPGIVFRDFPSRYSFNHVIIAIALPDDVPAEPLRSVIDHPRLGRLLLFDPTHPTMPLGQLPPYLEGSEALLVTSGAGEMITLPRSAPSDHRLAIRAKLALDAQGTLSGTVEETRSGWLAAEYRYALSNLQTTERPGWIRARLQRDLIRFDLDEMIIDGLDQLDREVVVRYRITVPGYGRAMGDLLLARPRLIDRKVASPIEAKGRRYPYEMRGLALETDEIEITLAEGLRVDELTEPVEILLPSLTYRSRSHTEDSVVRYHREYTVLDRQVPADGVEALSGAFRRILADEKASLVLRRE